MTLLGFCAGPLWVGVALAFFNNDSAGAKWVKSTFVSWVLWKWCSTVVHHQLLPPDCHTFDDAEMVSARALQCSADWILVMAQVSRESQCDFVSSTL